MIRRTRPEEHEALSALALRSKGHWGYPPEFLEACREELRYDAETCGSELMWAAERDGTVLGIVRLAPVTGAPDQPGPPDALELEALFVDLPAIGTGCGRLLLEHALAQARARGARRVLLDADPGAESFYRRFGAVRIGSAPSGSIPGRMLPRLEYRLGEEAEADGL